MRLVVTACLISGLTRATDNAHIQNHNKTALNNQQDNLTGEPDQNSHLEI